MADIRTVEGLMTEARHFSDIVFVNPTAYSISETQAGELKNLVQNAEAALAARTTAENALTVARAEFKADFEALSDLFRPLRQSVKENPATTDVQRAELHLTSSAVPDAGDSLDFAPLVLVENSGVHQHRINFFMQGEQSGSTKKPKGTLGAKIYCKIDGAATADLKDYDFITLDTKSPYVYDFEATNAGKQAHYIVLWTDADDNTSPQSEAFSLIVT